MSDFKRGDIIKSGNGIYKVCGFTHNFLVIPDGWLIVDEVGSTLNPKFCEHYTGATSAIPQHIINNNAPI